MKYLLCVLLLVPLSIKAEINVDEYASSLDFAQVLHVRATQSKNSSWCFHTRVRHNDQGWKHYANGWEVIDVDGNQLGERPLAHPHDKEQPFTRSQCGINIPNDITQVIVRAKCNVHGFGGKPIVVDLSQSKGKGFIVKKR